MKTSTIIIVCVAAIAAFFVFKMFAKREKTAAEPIAEEQNSGVPAGLEQDYKYGVDPRSCGKPVMYTLHTCRHCVHLKDFLDAHGIEHHLVYVDDFHGPARREVLNTLRSFNARGSFPTLVLPDGRSMAGFREGVVKELFGLD